MTDHKNFEDDNALSTGSKPEVSQDIESMDLELDLVDIDGVKSSSDELDLDLQLNDLKIENTVELEEPYSGSSNNRQQNAHDIFHKNNSKLLFRRLISGFQNKPRFRYFVYFSILAIIVYNLIPNSASSLTKNSYISPETTQKSPTDVRRILAAEELAKQALAKQALAKQALAKQELAKQELAKQELAKQELAKQELAKQELAKQELAKQALAKQALAKQALAKQELAKQELAKQALAKQALAKQALAKQALAKQELAKQELAKQELAKQELAKQALAKQALAKQELAKQALAKQALAKQALAKQALAKQELAKQALAKQELAKQELAKQELAKQELAKQELAKQELAKQELAKQELAKQELAKQELETKELNLIEKNESTESTVKGQGVTEELRVVRLIKDAVFDVVAFSREAIHLNKKENDLSSLSQLHRLTGEQYYLDQFLKADKKIIRIKTKLHRLSTSYAEKLQNICVNRSNVTQAAIQTFDNQHLNKMQVEKIASGFYLKRLRACSTSSEYTGESAKLLTRAYFTYMNKQLAINGENKE